MRTLSPTIDLMVKKWGDSNWRKLEAACAEFGIKHANGLRGSDMIAAWKEKRLGDIVAHCLDDIRCEWDLYQAMRASGKYGL